MHDLFTVNKAKVKEFCEAVRGKGYLWRCSARMDCVDTELLSHMYEAGCRSIYYGVETGSPRMQKAVSKHLNLELYQPILDSTIALGMLPTASFITGYPEEEQEDQNLTLDLIGSSLSRYPEDLTIQLHLLTPEPGTRLVEQFDNALDYDGHISDFNFPTLESDDAAIMRDCPEVFMNHHYYRGRVARSRHVLVTSGYLHLYKLGFPLLRHLLRNMEVGLSGLFSAMTDWSERTGNGPRMHSCDIVDFFSDYFGSSNYLVSLVRYRLAAAELGREMTQAELSQDRLNGMGDVAASDRIRLSRGTTILRDIHRCPELLELLSGSLPQPDVEIPERLRDERIHLVLYQEHPEPRRIRNFELNESSARLLEYFEHAHSYPEFLREFSLDAPLEHVGVAPNSVVAWLLEVGILSAVRDGDLRAAESSIGESLAGAGSQPR
jgi:hypothetical protein